MRISALVGAAALALALTACGSSDDKPMDDAMTESAPSMTDGAMDDSMSAGAADRSGSFVGAKGKTVVGSVEVTDGKLVLAGFSSDEGPDLHLYLAKGDDAAAVAAGTELGKVAYDEASQTFELDDVDADDYDTVVVHCDKAKVVFGAAALS